MFIKLIEIYYEWEGKKISYKLRETVVNKKNIRLMRDHKFTSLHEHYEVFPEGINPAHKYTSIMLDNDTEIIVVGELDHIYKFLEKDSELNYRQTLRG